jgi:hypothetical protein
MMELVIIVLLVLSLVFRVVAFLLPSVSVENVSGTHEEVPFKIPQNA